MTDDAPGSARWERIRSLFGQALDREPEERDAWLARAAEGDAGLLSELRSLLAHVEGDDVVVPDGDGAGTAATRALPPGHPERIGPYRVLALLGEGGMGAVYEAEQDHPQRLVALKILRVALASGEARRRFLLEGEVLGRLRHPAVAHVYGMGTATLAAGVEVPFLAMEHVQGARTLSAWVRESAPALPERLELFCAVVDGIEHAHQQGIVHRDIKPANILVDAAGRPKVIDFGLAGAVGEASGLASMHTRTGQVMGTPTYMSPEQFAGNPRAIGLATDIYSLGVLLFELVSGRLPHELSGLSLAEMARAVRDTPPQRLAGSTGTHLHDDLDTIVAKALEKQPERRYETAAALAADVRRTLRHEPILARPASVSYRTLLFVRRHRLLVASLAVVLLVAVAATVVSLQFAWQARRRADEADRAAYIARILGAESAIDGQHFAEASGLLAATPEALRGWEYRHLSSQLERTLPVPPHPDWLLAGIAGTGAAARTVVTRKAAGGGLEAVVIDVESGTERLAIPVPGFWCVALSPEGGRLAVLDRPTRTTTRVTIRDVASGRPMCVTEPVDLGEDGIERIRWHPSGDRLLLSTSRGYHVYAAGTGTLLGSGDLVNSQAAWTADGRWIVALSAGMKESPTGYAAWLVDGTSLQRRPGSVPIPSFGRLSPAPAGSRVVVLIGSGSHSVLDVVDGELVLVQDLAANAESTPYSAWSADGRLVAGSTLYGQIRVWDVATGAIRHEFAESRLDYAVANDGIAFLPDSGDLLSRDRSGAFRVWPVASGAPDVLARHTSYVYPVSLSADGSLLLTGGWDGTVGNPGAVKLWDARTGSLVAELGQVGERCEMGALTPDGRHAVVGITKNSGAMRLEVVDLLEGRVRILVASMIRAGNIALHPGGRHLFHAGNTWDLLTGEQLSSEPLVPDRGQYSPDGRLLAITGGKPLGTLSQVRLLEVASGAEVGQWAEAPGRLSWMSAFSPDGRWFLIGWRDGGVSLREVATGRLVAELPDTGAEVIAVAMSPDGSRIATGGRDTIVRLWDTTHFDLVAQLDGHQRYVFSLAWSPDGERLYSGSGDGTVRIWDTRSLAEQVAAQKARAAALPEIERRVGRALADPTDPQRALEAVLAAGDLDTRDRELAAQAAMTFLVPRAEAQQFRATEGPNGPLPGDATPRGPAWIRAPRAAIPPVIDGRLDDPAWDAAPWTDAFVDIEGAAKPPPRFATRAKLLWDDTCLYVAASMEEPQVWATLDAHDDIILRENDFEVFVDPDGDRRWYGEIEVNALGTVFDLMLSRGYREGGQADHGWSPPGLRAAAAVDGTLNDPSDTDRGWTVELAIPYESLSGHGTAGHEATDHGAAGQGNTVLAPKAGDVWRVNFSRVEWQQDVVDGQYARRPDTREDNWVWTPHYTVDMHRPEQWGFVELVAGDG